MLRQPLEARIVSFIGPVAVGKSTHIDLLRNYLKLKNMRVVTTFIKSSHGLSYVLNRFITAPKAQHEALYHRGLIQPRSKNIVKKLHSLYCFLDVISIAAKFFFTVYLPFCFGFTVLIEEGLIMTLYTYTVAFPQFFDTQPTVPPIILSLLKYISHKGGVNIVLDASFEELVHRRRHRGYRTNELAEYIRMQKEWVKRLNLANTILINTTNKSRASVHREIVAALTGSTHMRT